MASSWAAFAAEWRLFKAATRVRSEASPASSFSIGDFRWYNGDMPTTLWSAKRFTEARPVAHANGEAIVMVQTKYERGWPRPPWMKDGSFIGG
ncbi:hypothetical protein ACRQ5Q_41695 (plasmid) [Bradyrhizobium sp. PMVTL-01]|uniref:hypothetical protein n=1 Tax=Bradyrhizobium sp. PMVTL-01 TaxID=3434999 RepID=UPI003F72D522